MLCSPQNQRVASRTPREIIRTGIVWVLAWSTILLLAQPAWDGPVLAQMPAEKLQLARDNFLFGDYAAALGRLAELLESADLEVLQREEVLVLKSRCQIRTGEADAARETLSLVLGANPEWTPPVDFSPIEMRMFEELRSASDPSRAVDAGGKKRIWLLAAAGAAVAVVVGLLVAGGGGEDEPSETKGIGDYPTPPTR